MTTAPTLPRHVGAVVGAGLALTAIGLVLYLTAWSRAAGLALAPFALALLGAAIWMRQSQRWPSRRVRIAFLAIAALALAYAIGLAVYAALQPALPA